MDVCALPHSRRRCQRAPCVGHRTGFATTGSGPPVSARGPTEARRRPVSTGGTSGRLRYLLRLPTFRRIAVTSYPRLLSFPVRAGNNCRSFAAAALPSTNRHQVVPSMGPGRMEARKGAGIRDSIAARRSVDSRASCASRAKVGESSAASCRGTGWWRRFMRGLRDERGNKKCSSLSRMPAWPGAMRST